MKKRVLSMFMALALCFSMLPTAALATENTTEPSTQLTEPTPVPQEPETPDQGENTEPSAAEAVAPVGEVSDTADSPHTHYLCGGDTCNKVGHHENTKTTFTAWTDSDSLPATKGNYYLTSDVTLTTTWTCNDDVTLCLNGYSIKFTPISTANPPVISVADGKTFTLTDCNSSKSSKHFKKDDSTGRWVQDDNAGTINVDGGAIFCQNDMKGGCVQIEDNSTFNMYGGTICGNGANNGGGVYVYGGCTFNMYGGTIAGNTAEFTGGGVNVRGTFTMSGGTITDNTANTANLREGGGVCVPKGGTFTMSGGSITENNAEIGGGVYVYGTFTMSGGTITDNTANSSEGGGVYVEKDSSSFNVAGNVTITGNKNADKAANNVYLRSDKTITILVAGLSQDARIGVTTAEAPEANPLIRIATGASSDTLDYARIFTPDVQNQDYEIIKNEKENTLYLSGHQHSWGYTLSEDKTTITATCQASDCPYQNGGSVTINKPLHEVYGDGKSAEATLTKTDWTAGDVSIAYKEGESPLSSAPTDAGTYTASITVTDKIGKNTTASVGYTIAQADYTGATTANGSAIFGTEGTVDLSALIVEGGKLSLGTATDTNRILDGDPTVEGKTLKFKFNNGATADQTATVPVKVTNIPNYNGYDITVTLTVTDKDVPTVTPPTVISGLVYNGQEQALITAGTVPDGCKMLYKVGTDDGKWTDSIPTGKNAANYVVSYKVVGNEQYANVDPMTLPSVAIAQKKATIRPKSYTITKGQAIPEFKLEFVGLVSGETLTPSKTPTFRCLKVLTSVEEVTDSSVPGKYPIEWMNSNGIEFNDGTNYELSKEAIGYLTVQAQSSGGSSSSGGGGGGSSSSDRDNSTTTTGKTDTTTKPDGTTVKTETRADGTKIQTETKKDGSTVKTETKKDGSSVTENKAANGSTGTVKTDKNGQTTAETALSSKAIEDAKKSGEAVKAPVEVKATRDSDTAPTVKVELPKGAGETKVEIPVSNVKPGTVAVLVHADGTEEIVKNSLPTEDGIQLTVNGGATVKIVDNSKDFIDTRNHWAKDAIDFVSARGLVNGMSGTTYAPDASTTRAQLWTILARQNDADLNGGNTWYEKAQLWSKDKGVSDGANPNGTIDRAQMVTMLWRAMGQPAAASGASFADVPADSYYAQAVAWAIENGITAGVGGGHFDPNSTCTRAQIATFLYRLYLSR